MELKGTIKKIQIRKSVSDDTIQTLTLEVFGNILPLQGLLDTPLRITVEPE